jgi:hypothetical protein
MQLYVMTSSDMNGTNGSFDGDGRVRDLKEMECAATPVVSIKSNESQIEVRGRQA